MSKHKIIFIAILVLGSITRLFQLGDMPRGLIPEEVAMGNSAWALLQSGSPIFTESVYTYVAAPFVALLGLDAFSVRLVSALAGIISIYGIYLLVKIICEDTKNNKTIALIGGFLYATSPLSTHLSRAAFEANLMLSFVIFGIYFLLMLLQTNKVHHAIYTFILLGLATYTYYPALGVVLVLMVVTLIKIKSPEAKKLLVLTVTLVVVALPKILSLTISPLTFQTLELYASYFSPTFLFFTGDKTDFLTTTKEFGIVYAWEIITIIIGSATLQRNKISNVLMIGWILAAPLIAALTETKLNTLGAVLILPPLVILSAIGAKRSLEKLSSFSNNLYIRKTIVISLIMIPLYSTLAYLHTYYQHYKHSTSWEWYEHTTLLAKHITQIKPTQNILIESQPQAIEYIKFFNASQNKQTDQTRYRFVGENEPVVAKNGDIIAIAGWKGSPSELKNIHEIKLLNGVTAYKVGVFEQ